VLEHDDDAQSQTDTRCQHRALSFARSSSSTVQRKREAVKRRSARGRLAYTLAFATATVGINILTITFVPILIGWRLIMACIWSRATRGNCGWQIRAEAMAKAMTFTGQGIFVGALTTAGRFLADAHGFQGHPGNGLICARSARLLSDDDDAAALLCADANVIDHKTGARRGARI